MKLKNEMINYIKMCEEKEKKNKQFKMADWLEEDEWKQKSKNSYDNMCEGENLSKKK